LVYLRILEEEQESSGEKENRTKEEIREYFREI